MLMVRKRSTLDWIVKVLLLVGGLNWGLVGFFNYELVGALLGPGSTATRVVFGAVGLAALYKVWCLAQEK